MDCRLAGPWSISLNPGHFLCYGVLKAKGRAPVRVWAVVLAPWGQLKNKFILGHKLSYLSQCRAPGSCCSTDHTAAAISLFFWAFPSSRSHGTVVCTELSWRCTALEAAPHCLWEYLGAPAAEIGVRRWRVGCWPASGVVLLLAVWELHVGPCWEGLPPPTSAVLVGQSLAAALSCERTAIQSVSCVICAVGQQSPASTAALLHASTTSEKLFNHVDTDLMSGPLWMTEKCASTPSHWALALQISLPLYFVLIFE